MAQTAVLKIKLDIEGGKQIELSVQNIKELKEAIKTLKDTRANLEIGSDGFKEASKQIAILETALKSVTKTAETSADAINRAQDELNEPPKAIGYYRQLQNELVVLKNRFKDLNEAQAKGAVGQALAQQVNEISSKLKGLDANLGDYQRNIGNYASGFDTVAGGITKVVGVASTAIGLLQGGSKIIETARAFEKLGAILNQSFKGDTFAASSAFNEIKDLAAQTPQSLQQLTEGFLILSRDGVKPTVNELRKLTDLAVSQGKDITQLAEAVQDAQGGEFARLQEFGIRAKTAGDQITFAFQNQVETFKKGSPEIAKFIASLGDLPGIAGSSAAIAKTLDGAISNLGDNFDRIFAALGSGGGILQGFVNGLNSMLSAVVDFVEVPLSEQLREEQLEFNGLIDVLKSTTAGVDAQNIAKSELVRRFPEYIKTVNDEKNGQIDLARTLELGNRLFEQRIFLQSEEEKTTQFVKDRIERAQRLVDLQKDLSAAQAEYSKQVAASSAAVSSQFSGPNSVAVSAADAKRRIEGNIEALKKERAELEKAEADFKAGQKDRAAAVFGSAQAADDAANAFAKYKEESIKGAAVTKAVSESAKLAAGSIAFLEKQISDISEKINKSPKLDLGLVEKLNVAKAELERAKKLLASAELDVFAKSKGIDIEQLNANIKASGDVVVIPSEAEIQSATISQKGKDDLKRETENALLAVDFPILSDEQLKAKEEENKVLEEFRQQQQKAAQDDREKAARDEEEAKQRKIKNIQEVGEIAATVANSLLEIENARIEKTLNAEKSAIDKEYEAKIKAADGNAVLQDQLRKEQEAKTLAAEKKAAEQRKKIAQKEAIIQYALALIKTAGNPFQIAAATAIFLANIAAIQAQQFAKGGKVKKLGSGIIKERPNAPTTAGGDNILAYLKAGEMVLNEQQQQRAKMLGGGDFFHKIGVPNAGRPYPLQVPQRFATGGTVATSQTITVQTELSEESINLIASRIATQTAVQVGAATEAAIMAASNEAQRKAQFEARLNG